MGVMVSSSLNWCRLSLPLLIPQDEDSSHSSPAPVWRLFSRETVLHKLLQHECFPWGAVLHELSQCGSFPRGAVLQEWAAPVWVSHGATSPASKSAPVWAPLSTSPQILAGACSCAGVPTGSQIPAGIHLLWCGIPSTGYRWISAPPCTTMDCRATTCLTMIFSTSCKGRLSAPASWAPLPPPSSLTLVSAELFLSHRLTPFSTAFSPQVFLSFPLKYVITEVLSLSLIGLALASGGSILESANTGFIRHGGRFSQKPPL